jgi:hypothetical protein
VWALAGVLLGLQLAILHVAQQGNAVRSITPACSLVQGFLQ